MPTEDQLLRMVQRGHLPLMIGTDCQVDYALSQDNEAGLLKAAYQPPQPVVLYLGMSKHSPIRRCSNRWHWRCRSWWQAAKLPPSPSLTSLDLG